MERRNFIKSSCSFCIAVGAGIIFNSVSSCTPLPIYKTIVSENKISVPQSLFANSNLQIVSAKEAEYDIALRKEPDGTFTALQMRCTHADNPLTSTGNGFTCTLHGSNFNNAGEVTKGPAAMSLNKYSTEKIGDSIVIRMN